MRSSSRATGACRSPRRGTKIRGTTRSRSGSRSPTAARRRQPSRRSFRGATRASSRSTGCRSSSGREGPSCSSRTATCRASSAADSAKLLAEGPVPDRLRRAEPSTQALVPVEISPGRADVVFPIIHGTTGEDGTLQGFLDFLGLPYVGAGVTGSAIGMDKAVFKALLAGAGIPTPRSVVVRPQDRGERARRLAASLPPPPLFVKPATGGSSVGVVKVADLDSLDRALAEAFRSDDRALVEA